MKFSPEQETEIRRWTSVQTEILPTMERTVQGRLQLILFDGKQEKRIAFTVQKRIAPNKKITSQVERTMKDKLIEKLAGELNKPFACAIFSVITNEAVFVLKKEVGRA